MSRLRDLMVNAAHRYCLGRATYIVSDCIEWLLDDWGDFDKRVKDLIIRDTEEAIECDRAGDEMDKRVWSRFLEIVKKRETEKEKQYE